MSSEASTSSSTAASAAVPAASGSSTAGSAGPGGAPFANEHMHFDTQSAKWIFENPETGQELEWNTAANAWIPVVTDDVVQAQQAAYSVEGVDESAPTNVVLARDRKKKRKLEEAIEGTTNKKTAKPKATPRNTAVYLQRLPLDATKEEVSSIFGKAGLILLDADGEPKVKLYDDSSSGQRNGEGLVVYYKEESVELAIQLLDDTPLRLGDKEVMKVAKADWGHKATENGNGEGDAAPTKKRGKSDAVKQKMQRRAEKLQREAADYDPSYDEKDSPVVAQQSKPTAAGGRVVVLQHAFTLDELQEDASLLLDLKEDIREECENLGKVTNVVLYDQEADGIVTIKFADPIAAQACIIKNHDRFFGGRQLKAWLYDGKTRYKKSGAADFVQQEGESADDAEKRRLEEFGKWLEEDVA